MIRMQTCVKIAVLEGFKSDNLAVARKDDEC